MSLILVTARTSDPVSLEDAKIHLRADSSDEDALIANLVTQASDEAEHLTGRALLPQTWRLTLDRFGSAPGFGFGGGGIGLDRHWIGGSDTLLLPRAPLIAVSSIKYLQYSDGVLTTLAPAAYVVASAGAPPARITPAYATFWPPTRELPEAVQIVFTAGWADADHVPAAIKSWIKLRVGALYENREAWTLGQNIERNAFVDGLLDRYVCYFGPQTSVPGFGTLGGRA